MGAAASTQDESDATGVTVSEAAGDGGTIPVRALPSHEAPVIGRIPCGEQAKLITDAGDFIRISWNEDLSGWVDRRSLDLDEGPSEAAATAAAGEPSSISDTPMLTPRAGQAYRMEPNFHSHSPASFAESIGAPRSYSRGAVQPPGLAAARCAPIQARLRAAEAARAAAGPPRPLLQAIVTHSAGHPAVSLFTGPRSTLLLGEVPSGDMVELLAERGDRVEVRWNHLQGWAERPHVLELAAPGTASMVCMMPTMSRLLEASHKPGGKTLNQLSACNTMEQSQARKEAMDMASVPELPSQVTAMFSALTVLQGPHMGPQSVRSPQKSAVR